MRCVITLWEIQEGIKIGLLCKSNYFEAQTSHQSQWDLFADPKVFLGVCTNTKTVSCVECEQPESWCPLVHARHSQLIRIVTNPLRKVGGMSLNPQGHHQFVYY